MDILHIALANLRRKPARTAAISVLALLLALVTSVIATFRPIRRISRKSPYYAMRVGG
jgi:ABC-type lipoprotein release transport system permease subunit